MGHVPHADRVLFVHVGVERPLVVDAEVEDAVLVRGDEVGAEDGGVGGCEQWGEIETVEGREHGELKLERVALGDGERLPGVPDVLGNRNGVGLRLISNTSLGAN